MPHLFYRTKSYNKAAHLSAEEKHRKATQIALEEGAKAAAVVSLVWLPPAFFFRSYARDHSHKWFNNQIFRNGSVTASFMLLPIVLAFFNEATQVVMHLGHPLQIPEFSRPQSSTERATCAVFDHPIRSLTVASVPIAGLIYRIQAMDPALTFAERMMHTRILSQMAATGVFLGMMGVYTCRQSKKNQE